MVDSEAASSVAPAARSTLRPMPRKPATQPPRTPPGRDAARPGPARTSPGHPAYAWPGVAPGLTASGPVPDVPAAPRVDLPRYLEVRAEWPHVSVRLLHRASTPGPAPGWRRRPASLARPAGLAMGDPRRGDRRRPRLPRPEGYHDVPPAFRCPAPHLPRPGLPRPSSRPDGSRPASRRPTSRGGPSTPWSCSARPTSRSSRGRKQLLRPASRGHSAPKSRPRIDRRQPQSAGFRRTRPYKTRSAPLQVVPGEGLFLLLKRGAPGGSTKGWEQD